VITPISALGRGVARSISRLGALARFFVRTLVAIPTLSRAGRRVLLRVLIRQIWFTAVQAVPLLIILASILSFLVISQAVRELGRIGATELIGSLMVIAIVRELGPLLTALVVAGRSGTAIAAELATNKVMGELNALEGMGIDPWHYLVLPRFGAAILSISGLIVLFDVVAILAGFMAAATAGMTAARYFEIVLASLTFRDVWMSVVKGVVFGTIAGMIPSFAGMSVRGASTEVPIAASQAVVGSIFFIFLGSGLFVLLI
jgi:phospholipid/cholesterol/gamma-HCH transport system permease protein